MPAYVAPAQPANTPTFPNNASTAVIKAVTAVNNLKKREWAIICGFRRGVGTHTRDTLDLEFYSALENEDYGYLNALPRQYFVHLEQEYYPLDVIAIFCKPIRGDSHIRGHVPPMFCNVSPFFFYVTRANT